MRFVLGLLRLSLFLFFPSFFDTRGPFVDPWSLLMTPLRRKIFPPPIAVVPHEVGLIRGIFCKLWSSDRLLSAGGGLLDALSLCSPLQMMKKPLGF